MLTSLKKLLALITLSREAMASEMTEAKVHHIDQEGGLLTLRYAEIKELGVPGMTMVCVVKDKAMLDKLRAGDKVKFKAVNEGGKFTVTQIEPVR
jgi:Cu(I)/Ag(I) efflux system periplasmic protein CusF